jgi:hypothetical protein
MKATVMTNIRRVIVFLAQLCGTRPDGVGSSLVLVRISAKQVPAFPEPPRLARRIQSPSESSAPLKRETSYGIKASACSSTSNAITSARVKSKRCIALPT